jgi:signal transduction histidine kinase/CheY-like chemotaxis protein
MILFISSLVSLGLSFSLGNEPIILGAAGLLFLYLAAIVRDVWGALSAGFEKVPGQPAPLTSLGERLRQREDLVRYKLHCLNWELESSRAGLNQRVVEEVGSFDFLKFRSQGGQSDFFEHILAQVRNSFSCAAVAVALRDGQDQKNIQIFSEGVSGPRFETQLRRYLKRYFESGKLDSFGLKDAAESHSISDDFSAYGFRYHICEPFMQSEGGIGAIWAGYQSNRPPLAKDSKRLKDLIPHLQSALQSFTKFQELGGKVLEAEHLNREKTEVIAHISHDIRSPLANLKAILRLLKLESAKQEDLDLVEAALSNCDSLGEMVEDLLDYSRHRMGHLEANPELFCLAQLARETLGAFAVTAAAKGLRLEVRQSVENLWVRADRKQLKRVVSNLISNAIKYTLQGGVSLELGVTDGQAALLVRDTGVGMSSVQLARLFAPFTRFNSVETEGIGLGLALSRALVELNHGKLEARSNTGAGSCFSLMLEAAKEEDAPTAAPLLHGYEDLLSGRRVLLVDDDPGCLDSLARVLTLTGCTLFTAQRTTEAQTLMDVEGLDAVISDATMPDGGGAKLLEYLKASGKEIPLAILSGRGEDRRGFVKLGADKFFLKPVEISELVEWLRQAPSAAIGLKSKAAAA